MSRHRDWRSYWDGHQTGWCGGAGVALVAQSAVCMLMHHVAGAESTYWVAMGGGVVGLGWLIAWWRCL